MRHATRWATCIETGFKALDSWAVKVWGTNSKWLKRLHAAGFEYDRPTQEWWLRSLTERQARSLVGRMQAAGVKVTLQAPAGWVSHRRREKESRQEEEKLKAEFLAQRGVTLCPPAGAERYSVIAGHTLGTAFVNKFVTLEEACRLVRQLERRYARYGLAVEITTDFVKCSMRWATLREALQRVEPPRQKSIGASVRRP